MSASTSSGARLAEPPPGRIQLLAGPRQVGKTTLLLALAGELGPAAIYAACDSPEASLPGLWERLWHQAEATAAEDGRAIVLCKYVRRSSQWDMRCDSTS
jgi:predicted AAA+ superfamily ATPase